ncbi:MAG TPA: bi-domain-containing oxidoreductase [Thermoanaerobaculia bacterium]|nr:bi-domain-containing oxidoreductase [Thermoanaerobaculia bacterium]
MVQPAKGGDPVLQHLPAPTCGPFEILVSNRFSLVSAGTERSIITLAGRSLLGKALERPDQVKRVLQKVRAEGIAEAVRQVRERLADPVALGYSAAGLVLEVGSGVGALRPGDLVACAAPHAEVAAVPENLAARVPAGTPLDQAAYAVLAAIALNGLRLASVSLGSTVVIIGLGVVGQLAVMLLQSSGCHVIASDVDESRRNLAHALGATSPGSEDLRRVVGQATGGHGADSVLLTAATVSNEPLELAAEIARRRARLVALGAVGLRVPRRAFYDKELELVVASSYGPGRYDQEYEERGRDYPLAHVRWTAQRNIEAAVNQIAKGALDVSRLTSHTFEIGQYDKAYELVTEASEPYMGVLLEYPGVSDPEAVERRITVPRPPGRRGQSTRGIAIGVVGAGNFATSALIPTLARTKRCKFQVLCSRHGLHAATRGARHGFRYATSEFDMVLADPDVEAVFIVTRHHLHAGQLTAGLRAGRPTFVEKPLAITRDELAEVERAIEEIGAECPVWTIGFNRRFAPAIELARAALGDDRGAASLSYRFNAGVIAADHWLLDPAQGGGRLIGEACHALDTIVALLGAQIERVYAERTPAPPGQDQTVATIRLSGGHAASLSYVTGDRSVPKERIEITCNGQSVFIDDFRSVRIVREGRTRTKRWRRRTKGHRELLEAFLDAVKGNRPPPIPYAEILNVSWASLALVDSLGSASPVRVPLFA